MGLGVEQGPSANQGKAYPDHSSPWWVHVTDGTNDAGVTAAGRLMVDSVQGSATPTLLATLNGSSYFNEPIVNSGQYSNLLVEVITPSGDSITGLSFQQPSASSTTPRGTLPYSILNLNYDFSGSDQDGLIPRPLQTNYLNWTNLAGTDSFTRFILVNPTQDDISLFLASNSGSTIYIYGTSFDWGSFIPQNDAVDSNIVTVSIPNDGSFVQGPDQIMNTVVMSTVNAPGAIAFSYDGGTNYMEIPAGAVYTISGAKNLSNLTFAYIPTGSTYDLKLNWAF